MSPFAASRVLVAEDDPDILALVAHRLARSGHEVIPAPDGEEALRLAFEHRPDLMVLDVMMPHLDGYEVTRAIRRNPATEHIPVLLLTAHVQEDAVAMGYEAGADGHLDKPFRAYELRACIHTILGSRLQPAAA
jgi:DNA-binding response OmpR family regulator